MKTPHGYLLWYAWYGGLNGSNYENDKSLQKFITFVKSNELKKSFRNIVVEEQYFIFASQSTALSLYHVTIWVHHNVTWLPFSLFLLFSAPLGERDKIRHNISSWQAPL